MHEYQAKNLSNKPDDYSAFSNLKKKIINWGHFKVTRATRSYIVWGHFKVTKPTIVSTKGKHGREKKRMQILKLVRHHYCHDDKAMNEGVTVKRSFHTERDNALNVSNVWD